MNSVLRKMGAFFLVSMVLLGLGQVARATELTPEQLMQQTADKLFGDIKENQAKIKQDPNYLRQIVRQDLMPYVHYKYAGSLVLGAYFRSTSPEQREPFFNAFQQFIEQTYAQALTLYHNQKIIIEKPKATNSDSNISVIRVVVVDGNKQNNLDFYWRKNTRTGEWQVYDMAAEGVSMIATKQKEWAPILRKEGIEILTKQIEKSAKAPIVFSK
ncbi:phospholipid-binding protein MlaC [Mergibacter septicus]|nr:phospholipid-binding protein MlaC [Mergibacter septicus]AWX14492.1 phospholipid-binding protein MlaC [Mergibacter septicus]